MAERAVAVAKNPNQKEILEPLQAKCQLQFFRSLADNILNFCASSSFNSFV
jgi:hypothetical protein